MENVALSSVNAKYLTSTIKKAQENIELEKSIKKPEIKQEDKTQTKDNAKLFLYIVAIGALVLNLLALVSKLSKNKTPDNSSIDKLSAKLTEIEEQIKVLATKNSDSKTDISLIDKLSAKLTEIEEQIKVLAAKNSDSDTNSSSIKKLNEALEEIKKQIQITTETITPKKISINDVEFKDKIPYFLGSDDIVNGTIVKKLEDGTRFELVYLDGKIIQSRKFDKENNEIFKKIYKRALSNSAKGITETIEITKSDSSPIERLYRRINQKSDNGDTKIRINVFKKDKNKKVAQEITKFNKGATGIILYKTESKKGPFALSIKKNGERREKLFENGFNLKETTMQSLKDKFKCFVIDTKNN